MGGRTWSTGQYTEVKSIMQDARSIPARYDLKADIRQAASAALVHLDIGRDGCLAWLPYS